uniref:Probable RNA polymerase II nuclear localization protein SLC7A6OS n=1 Tax=Strongyloides venezuelensis TaxID=75913 RepID=A0A0K0FMC7_STRVS
MCDNVIPVIRVRRKRTLPSIPGIVLTVKKCKGCDGNAIGRSFTDQGTDGELTKENNHLESVIQENSFFKLCKSADTPDIDKAGVVEKMDVEIALIDYNARKNSVEALGNPNLTPSELLSQFAAMKTEEKRGVTIASDTKDDDDVVYDYYLMNGRITAPKFSQTDIDECNLREATYDEIQFYYGGDSDSENERRLNGFYESDDSNDEGNWRNDYPDEESSGFNCSDDDSFDEYGDNDNAQYVEYVNDHSESENESWNE